MGTSPSPVAGRFGQAWRYALQMEIKGRGLDGIAVGLDGDMVVKVNQLHPDALKQCETEEGRRSMEAESKESKERFKKEVDYLLKHPTCPCVVPILPIVYVMGENSRLLGYLMPELKSADQFEWPNKPRVFRQLRLIPILCFFRKSQVVYSDYILLREVPGGF